MNKPSARRVVTSEAASAVPVAAEPVLVADEVIDDVPDPTARRLLTLGNLATTVVLSTVLAGCALYANLSFAVTNHVHYRYFPPFRPYVNVNNNDHLGAEYFCIARSLVAGEGFASPFKEKTGPTAWMPPVLPVYLAGLLLVCGGNQDAVMIVVIITQVATLIATGLLVLALAWQHSQRLAVIVAAGLFLVGVISDFHLWFQQTHDGWIVLLALDLVLAGCCWAAPLTSKKRTALWGVSGGLVALISPIVGFTWGSLCLALTVRQRAWKPGLIAVLAAGLTMAPWAVRNYLVLGRLIPVKSNAAYELWQSQCLTPDGLLQMRVFGSHPYGSPGRERQQYKALGEIAYLDRKQELFWASVMADPLDFLDRVACRGLATTVWYVPSDRQAMARRPWTYWTCRMLHPLPFLAMLFLIASAFVRPLHPAQWVAIGVYVLYLAPYVLVSYYDRYGMPLVAVKALFVVWAADRLWSLLRAGTNARPSAVRKAMGTA